MEDPTAAERKRNGRESPATTVTAAVRRGAVSSGAIVAGVVVVLLLVAFVLAGNEAQRVGRSASEEIEPGIIDPAVDPTVDPTVGAAPSAPASLIAVEVYVANPSAEALRNLVESIGGLDAVVLGEAEGAFDLVRFDPQNPDRLLASMRSSYGEAENHETNELWMIEDGGITQTLWAPEQPHDFVHFNIDGTITMWVHSGEGTSFAPRTAVVLHNDGTTIDTSQPVYASRFTSAGGSVFALTGDGDYYSNDDTYPQLIADGATRRRLGNGRVYAWIDNPIPEILVAYPRDSSTGTAVWDAATLERIDGHPLDGRSYQRVAVSGDGRTAVAITLEGQLEQIDLATGRTLSVFGFVEADGIDQPITLNHDGSAAITVERSGLVTLWWVGVDEPIATLAGDAPHPRWVSEEHAARAGSAVASDASRVALRRPAQPLVPVTWVVIDTGVDRWIRRACDLAGRHLTPSERTTLDLPPSPVACD